MPPFTKRHRYLCPIFQVLFPHFIPIKVKFILHLEKSACKFNLRLNKVVKKGELMRLLFFFLFSIIGIVRAETLQNLSQNNASPDEIIRQLNTVSASSPNADIPTSESIQVGTLVSLIQAEDCTGWL